MVPPSDPSALAGRPGGSPAGPPVLGLLDEEAVTEAVADLLVDAVRRALEDRGTAVLALSGGRTPVPLYHRLADTGLDWSRVHVVQVDERAVADDDPDRNWQTIQADLVVPTGAVGHPMPVVGAPLEEQAAAYDADLQALCGGVVDALHLGLGADGHTASLVPDDPVVGRDDVGVAATGVYQGHRRMTMTAPSLNRAGRIVWQVVGESKREALDRLRSGSWTDPSGVVRLSPEVWLLAD